MPTLVTTMTPVFGLLALGFAVVRVKVLDAAAARGLVIFVFNVAIPALLFRSLARMELPPDIEWGFLLAFYVGSAATYALGMATGRSMFGRPVREQAIFGMGASYSNLVMMGIPIVLMAFGDEASLPMLLIIGFHSATFMPITVALIRWSGGSSESLGRQAAAVASEMLKNPIILGIGAGFVANLIGVAGWSAGAGGGLWAGFDRLLELLGAAAVPVALFAMGCSLAAYPLRGELPPAAALAVLKLAVHPFLVWLVAVPILGIEGLWVSVAIVLAGMPSAVNTYIFAARYEAAADVAARTVLLASLCSMATIAVLLALVGG